MTLPAGYVGAHVDYGYARTVDTAQGATVDHSLFATRSPSNRGPASTARRGTSCDFVLSLAIIIVNHHSRSTCRSPTCPPTRSRRPPQVWCIRGYPQRSMAAQTELLESSRPTLCSMSYVIDHARLLLSRALNDLMSAPFPQHPEDERLAEWILELAELDGHLAGLAHSALSARPARPLRSTAAINHATRLRDLSVADVDEPIWRQCRDYIARLQLIEEILAGRHKPPRNGAES